MVRLQLTINGQTEPLGCGATLVAQEWAITATHCMGVSNQGFQIIPVKVWRQKKGGLGDVVPLSFLLFTKYFNPNHMNNYLKMC